MAYTKMLDPPGPLQMERLPNGNRMLLRDLTVKLGDETEIIVPGGFQTDFSSIPRPARIFLHWSKVDIAAVVHDFPPSAGPAASAGVCDHTPRRRRWFGRSL